MGVRVRDRWSGQRTQPTKRHQSMACSRSGKMLCVARVQGARRRLERDEVRGSGAKFYNDSRAIERTLVFALELDRKLLEESDVMEFTFKRTTPLTVLRI